MKLVVSPVSLLLIAIVATARIAEAKSSNNDLTELSHFITREFSSRHDGGISSSRNGEASGDHHQQQQRRGLQTYLADFDDVCYEMQQIFPQQCACGDFDSQTSDLIRCSGSNGLEANAHFSDSDFMLETVTVCKNMACTTIHYRNTSGLSCQASYGGTDHQCRSCDVCETPNNLMGLDIDCTNVDPQLSTNCTAVSDLLDLSAAYLPSTRASSIIVGVTLMVLALAV